MGREFVNYRKWTLKDHRIQFSQKVRMEGRGNVPIVVDSVDEDLAELLSNRGTRSARYKTFGKELVMHMDLTVEDVLKEIKKVMLMKGAVDLLDKYTFFLGLENGDIIGGKVDLGTLYKKHRNNDDKILYMLLTKEASMYNYILSIIRYIGNYIKVVVKNRMSNQ